MSAHTPIIPPSSPLQRTRAAAPSKLVVTVSAIVVLHVSLLAGLLIQGCQREEKSANKTEQVSTPFAETTQPNLPGVEPTPTPAAPTAVQPQTTVVAVSPTPVPAVPDNATVKSASAQLAPGSVGTATNAAKIPGASKSTVAPSADHKITIAPGVYVVRPGDNITKIARNAGISPKALREANNLKTDRILVNQKLKVPAPQPGTATVSEAVPTPAPQ